MENKVEDLSNQLIQFLDGPSDCSDECRQSLLKLSNSIERVVFSGGKLPVPVQTFPVTDDFRDEDEKNNVAGLAEFFFAEYESNFSAQLENVSADVRRNAQAFFPLIKKAAYASGQERLDSVAEALKLLLGCSPKKILAEFQKQALAAGWTYVWAYNQVIDKIAAKFPRCRAGIFSSRLKYSDILQISQEILETVKTCSILLEDLQRRYDLLEALQNNIQADIKTPECDRIMTAIKESFADNTREGAYQDKKNGFFANMASGFDHMAKKNYREAGASFKGIIGNLGDGVAQIGKQVVTGVGDIAGVPALQIQGQMQRTQRLLTFIETANMFEEGWDEWEQAQKEIIQPNLRIMFELKRDFFRNQMICLCDMISFNGYSLCGLANELKQAVREK